MSYTDFFIRGADFNSDYNRTNHPDDNAQAVVPTYVFKGQITKGETEVRRIDGAVMVLSGVDDKIRQSAIAVWESLQTKNIMATLAFAVTGVLAGYAAYTVASTALTVIGVAIALSHAALTCLGIVRGCTASWQLESWKDPVAYAAKMRVAIPGMPLVKILPHVGTYLHQKELHRLFYNRVDGGIHNLESHTNSVHLESDKVAFVKNYFDNNPLNLINSVLNENTGDQGRFKLAVAAEYGSMKANVEELTADVERRVASAEKQRDIEIQTIYNTISNQLQKERAEVTRLESVSWKDPKNLTAKAALRKANLTFRAKQTQLEAAYAPQKNGAKSHCEKEIKLIRKMETKAFTEIYNKLPDLARKLSEARRQQQSETQPAQ